MPRIVWPDLHDGLWYRYERRNNRPDMPQAAALILDTVPFPSPEERRHVWLAEMLNPEIAECWDFVFVGVDNDAMRASIPGAEHDWQAMPNGTSICSDCGRRRQA